MRITIGSLLFLGVLLATPVQGMANTRQTLPSAQDQRDHREEGKPSAIGDTACIETFPISAYQAFFPLLLKGRTENGDVMQPDTVPPLSKVPGRIVPIGDQLDDVGQYYSQVAPSLSSALYISNVSVSSQPFTVTLYGDTGYVARAFRGCRIDANSTWMLQAGTEQLTFSRDGEVVPGEEVCAEVVQSRDERGNLIEPRLHGIYHAMIVTEDPTALEIQSETGAIPINEQSHSQPVALYHAIPSGQVSDVVHLPGIVATRDPGNWWDTEIVVQNSGDVVVDLTFRLCRDDGTCFANNRARLAAHERRNFLASHLLYQNDDGFLEEHSGWFSTTLIATRTDGSPSDPPGLAVVTNFFRQPVVEKVGRPQADQGSTCFHQASGTGTGRVWTLPLPESAFSLLRLYNPTASKTSVFIQLRDQQGVVIGSLEEEILPESSLAFHGDQLQARLAAVQSTSPFEQHGDESSRFLHVIADQDISLLAWGDGQVTSPIVPKDLSTHWYVPLFAAPIVPFHWDSEERSGPEAAQQPGATFGLSETYPAFHGARPDWARKLNWYDARYGASGFDRQWCNEQVSDSEPYSTYIPMWRGLGRCNRSFADDRSCLNTDIRLQKLRNDIPSSCAGRPLFLVNEPDLSAQTFMSHNEIGRLIYVLRDWPGELYSPVFASYSYENPYYPPEVLNWCKQAVAQSLCPQSPGCERCRQDGVIDGDYDPYDISFKGLEDYFGTEGRWARGKGWRFDKFVEGMLLHLYESAESDYAALQWRAPYLQQYRDRADEAGWPIIVKEYGFVVWSDGEGNWPPIDESSVATRIDDLRRLLQANLGNHQVEHLGNPKKLFWYQTHCSSGSDVWNLLCLFTSANTLSTPVGDCWLQDTVYNDDIDRKCGQKWDLHYIPNILN